jgi:hypothetical protein
MHAEVGHQIIERDMLARIARHLFKHCDCLGIFDPFEKFLILGDIEQNLHRLTLIVYNVLNAHGVTPAWTIPPFPLASKAPASNSVAICRTAATRCLPIMSALTVPELIYTTLGFSP